MIVIKKELLDKLIEDMEKCRNCTSIMSRYGKDYSLVNIYKDKEFSKQFHLFGLTGIID